MRRGIMQLGAHTTGARHPAGHRASRRPDEAFAPHRRFACRCTADPDTSRAHFRLILRPYHAKHRATITGDRHHEQACWHGASDAALALGIECARQFGARLTVLHVVDRMPLWATTSIDGECVSIDLPRNMTISRVIARVARELNADFIVVGQGRGLRWRFWEECVADAVSRHSNRRVLIVSSGEYADPSRAATKATPLSFTIVGSTQRTFPHID